MSRKICVVTGSRAEYGLLYWVMKEIVAAPELELQVVATGMHLSPAFGHTYREIENDGFLINSKVEMLLSSDTSAGISKSVGLGILGFTDALQDLAPDVIVLLGDRFESFAAAVAALFARIPIAHIHGGEVTQGAYDEALRHSITKMAHLHLAAAERYRERILQLGESPSRVFTVGSPGIENMRRLKLLSRPEIERIMKISLGRRSFLVTFHPVTLDDNSAPDQLGALLSALGELEDTTMVFTMPNADAGGHLIPEMIRDFVAKKPSSYHSVTNLGTLKYLSLMRCVDAVVGNSSSGIIEAPSLKIATVNIGNRQKGRLRATSIIDCEPSVAEIRAALRTVFSEDFRSKLAATSNPYGEGETSKRIVEILKTVDLTDILKKAFQDLPHGFADPA